MIKIVYYLTATYYTAIVENLSPGESVVSYLNKYVNPKERITRVELIL